MSVRLSRYFGATRAEAAGRDAVCVTRHEQTVPNKYRQRAHVAWASSPVQVLACPWHGVRPGAIVPPRYRKRWLDLRSRLPVAWTCDSVPADCMSQTAPHWLGTRALLRPLSFPGFQAS